MNLVIFQEQKEGPCVYSLGRVGKEAGNKGEELGRALETMIKSLDFILCPKRSHWRSLNRDSHSVM